MAREIKMASVTLRERDAKAIVRAMNNLCNRLLFEAERAAEAGEQYCEGQWHDYVALRARFCGALKAAGIEDFVGAALASQPIETIQRRDV